VDVETFVRNGAVPARKCSYPQRHGEHFEISSDEGIRGGGNCYQAARSYQRLSQAESALPEFRIDSKAEIYGPNAVNVFNGLR
jgi:hypothetical protein